MLHDSVGWRTSLFHGVTLGLLAACATGSALPVDGDGGAGGATAQIPVDGGLGGTGGREASSLILTGGFSDGGNDQEASAEVPCASTVITTGQVFLDMYVMLDRSGSMIDTVEGGKTKWQAITSALTAFMTQPEAAGISMGIQFFGQPPKTRVQCRVLKCYVDSDCGPSTCGPCTSPNFLIPGYCDGFDAIDSCAAEDYATPAVEIAPLPAAAEAIASSMAGLTLTTGTPTFAALKGAVDHAREWAKNHPDHVVAAVLATDGAPNECDQNEDHLNAIAAAGESGSPKVLTFAIGVFTASDAASGAPAKMDDIAAAGGTNRAYVIRTQDDVATEFLGALDTIRRAAISFSYPIPVPESGTADPSTIRIKLALPGHETRILPRVVDEAHCLPGVDGWHFDQEPNPARIVLCEATCMDVWAAKSGQVDIAIGCKGAAPP